jgi:hypothetical protein
VSVIKSKDRNKKKLEFPPFPAVERMSNNATGRREAAVARMKVVVPTFFAIGFLFFSAITIFPLAGMPTPPLDPQGGVRQLLVWLAAACSTGGLFALFSGLVVALWAGSDDEAEP